MNTASQRPVLRFDVTLPDGEERQLLRADGWTVVHILRGTLATSQPADSDMRIERFVDGKLTDHFVITKVHFVREL